MDGLTEVMEGKQTEREAQKHTRETEQETAEKHRSDQSMTSTQPLCKNEYWVQTEITHK